MKLFELDKIVNLYPHTFLESIVVYNINIIFYYFNFIQKKRSTTVDTTEVSGANAYNGDVEYYIAAYPYESGEVGDLTFSAGEMIMVIKKEGDWWTGTIGNRTGMFPSNYVQKADIGSSAPTADTTDLNQAYEHQKVCF